MTISVYAVSAALMLGLLATSARSHIQSQSGANIHKVKWGTVDDKAVYLYTLDNGYA